MREEIRLKGKERSLRREDNESKEKVHIKNERLSSQLVAHPKLLCHSDAHNWQDCPPMSNSGKMHR